MAYKETSEKKDTSKKDKLTPKYMEQKIEEYQGEYTRWLNELSKYHTGRFQTNYDQYTAYAQTKGTHTKISDPVAPEQVERIIQKVFEGSPVFHASARGMNLPREMKEIYASIAEYMWNNPDILNTTGNRPAQLKVLAREFSVTGNTVTETYFNFKADNPDFRIIPIEDVVFDPAKTLKTSEKYYIRQFVSFDYLEKMAENGIFDEKIIKKIKKANDDEDDAEVMENVTNRIVRVGQTAYTKPVGKHELTTIWDGKKVCRIVDWEWVVYEKTDPMKIDDNPLDFAMDIELVGEPYALSFLDFINGLTKAKDLILNQVIDYGAKLLNPPLFVDPSLGPMSKKSLQNAWKLGGMVFANPAQASHQQMPPMPTAGMDLMGYIQQRAESSMGLTPYMSGVTNATSDKTRGTYRGISKLVEEGQSRLRDIQRNLELSIVQPIIQKWMKMAGNMMTNNETKWVLITGKEPRWIKITKGFLTGKIKLDDLYQAELINEEEAIELAATMIENGQDPAENIIFDLDWIVTVKAFSMAQEDKEAALQSLDQGIQMGVALGVPLDLKMLWEDRQKLAGMEEPEKYIIQQPMPGQMTAPPEPDTETPTGQLQQDAQDSVNKRMAIQNKRTLPSI